VNSSSNLRCGAGCKVDCSIKRIACAVWHLMQRVRRLHAWKWVGSASCSPIFAEYKRCDFGGHQHGSPNGFSEERDAHRPQFHNYDPARNDCETHRRTQDRLRRRRECSAAPMFRFFGLRSRVFKPHSGISCDKTHMRWYATVNAQYFPLQTKQDADKRWRYSWPRTRNIRQ